MTEVVELQGYYYHKKDKEKLHAQSSIHHSATGRKRQRLFE